MEHSTRVLLSVEDAAAALSISESTMWGLLRRGAVSGVLIGRRRLVPQFELDAYVQRLYAATT